MIGVSDATWARWSIRTMPSAPKLEVMTRRGPNRSTAHSRISVTPPDSKRRASCSTSDSGNLFCSLLIVLSPACSSQLNILTHQWEVMCTGLSLAASSSSAMRCASARLPARIRSTASDGECAQQFAALLESGRTLSDFGAQCGGEREQFAVLLADQFADFPFYTLGDGRAAPAGRDADLQIAARNQRGSDETAQRRLIHDVMEQPARCRRLRDFLIDGLIVRGADDEYDARQIALDEVAAPVLDHALVD